MGDIIRQVFGIAKMIGISGLINFGNHFLGLCRFHVKIFHTVAVAGLKKCINKNPEKSWVVAQDIIGAAAYNDAALGVGKLADDPRL